MKHYLDKDILKIIKSTKNLIKEFEGKSICERFILKKNRVMLLGSH